MDTFIYSNFDSPACSQDESSNPLGFEDNYSDYPQAGWFQPPADDFHHLPPRVLDPPLPHPLGDIATYSSCNPEITIFYAHTDYAVAEADPHDSILFLDESSHILLSVPLVDHDLPVECIDPTLTTSPSTSSVSSDVWSEDGDGSGAEFCDEEELNCSLVAAGVTSDERRQIIPPGHRSSSRMDAPHGIIRCSPEADEQWEVSEDIESGPDDDEYLPSSVRSSRIRKGRAARRGRCARYTPYSTTPITACTFSLSSSPRTSSPIQTDFSSYTSSTPATSSPIANTLTLSTSPAFSSSKVTTGVKPRNRQVDAKLRRPTPTARLCPVSDCRATVKRPEDLKRHLATHTALSWDDVLRPLCGGLPLAEAERAAQAQGIRLVREKIYVYEGKSYYGGCTMTFSRPDSLQRHLRRDKKGKPPTCVGSSTTPYNKARGLGRKALGL